MGIRFLLFTFLFGSTTVWAQFDSLPFVVESVRINGSGCPAGTARAEFSPDGSALTVLYDQFMVQVEGKDRNSRANCHVVIRIRKPEGYAFAVEAADFRGFISLDPGVRGEQKIQVESGFGEFAEATASWATQSWMGPVQDNFVVSATRPLEGAQFLSCVQPKKQARISVKSAILLRAGKSGGSGMLAIDSFDGSLVQTYRLRWIDCDHPSRGRGPKRPDRDERPARPGRPNPR